MENTTNEPLPVLDPVQLSNEPQQTSTKENHNLDKDSRKENINRKPSEVGKN